MKYPELDQQRRQILKSVGAFFALHGVDVNAQSINHAAPSVTEKETLMAFVDVLIPRDRFTGSASDLQVDAQIWNLSESSENLRRLLAMGCEWLNKTGGPPFSKLTYQQKHKLVTWMAESDWNHVPRRFYEILRSTSVSLYYAQPASWPGLAIDSPPQPAGYIPPWR